MSDKGDGDGGEGSTGKGGVSKNGVGEGSGDDGGKSERDVGDEVEKGSGEKGSSEGGGNSKDLGRMDKGIRFAAGVEGRPGGAGRGERSDGQLTMGVDSTELRRLHTEVTDAICMAAGMHRGPLGRLQVGGDGGAVEGAWLTKSEAGGGAGEGSTGASSALVTRSVGEVSSSGMGDERVRAGDDGADGA